MELEIYSPAEDVTRLALRPSSSFPGQICLCTTNANGARGYDLLRISAEGIHRFGGCYGCGIATEGSDDKIKLLN